MSAPSPTVTPAPVRKSLRVQVPPARAFAVFTADMGRWWPRTHSINASPLAEVVMEPRAGGRWFERGEDGSEGAWGQVLAWEPPHRLLLAWQIGADWRHDPGLATEVELRFVPDGPDATRVELEHRGVERFGAAADAMRGALDSAGGWICLLEAFRASAEA